jgi:hypothetical protein
MKTICVALAICVAYAARGQVVQLYVAPNGNDKWSGKFAEPYAGGADGPLATLEGARDAIRALKKGGLPAGGVTVWIRGGTYRISKTFELTAQDSGTTVAPIVYAAYKNEEVRLTGSLPIAHFGPVTDSAIRDRLDSRASRSVVQADLGAQGIADLGKFTARGFGRSMTPSQAELFVDDKPMTLTRYPKTGWLKIASVPAGEQGGQFGYDDPRPARWKDFSDVWMHGYWRWDWADSYEKIHSIDTANKIVTTEPPHGVFGYKLGQRFAFINVLEELTEPGEYYIDRTHGVLYLWPPKTLDAVRAELTVMEAPLISLKQASYVRLNRLIVECSRGLGLTMAGGVDDEVSGCTFRFLGMNAVTVDGTNCLVRSCDIHDIEDGAVTLSGGDRKTLQPGGNAVVNCEIHDFQTWVRTGRPGIEIFGVGQRVANNRIYNSPHCGIMLHGNDHLVEYNDVFRVCQETSDSGAFYMGRNYSERGNVVQCNYFHDLDARPDVHAVYLDDFASGTTVYGNVFVRAGTCIVVGGGLDNDIENNVFIGGTPAIHVDARGTSWAKKMFDPAGDHQLWNLLKAVNYDQPPYSTKYPHLADIEQDNPAVPKRNTISRNLAVGGRLLDLVDGLKPDQVPVLVNWEGGDPGFVSLYDRDFHLKPDHVALGFDFKALPLEKIGLYKDEYRRKVPGVWGGAGAVGAEGRPAAYVARRACLPSVLRRHTVSAGLFSIGVHGCGRIGEIAGAITKMIGTVGLRSAQWKGRAA